MVKKRKRKLRKGILFLLFVMIAGVIGAYMILSGKIEFSEVDEKTKDIVETEIKQIQIVDVESNTRPVAVMINNHPSARTYHMGLQDAYLTYEIIVEGGYTRYMAIYKDKTTKKIGSVRSSRHYFLDYALENDAIYVHWGFSPQAGKQMDSYNVDHFDGLNYENKYFFRDRTLNVSLEHTGFTSMELINKAVIDLGFRAENNKELLLNYSADPVDLEKKIDAVVALEVIIPYSGVVTTSYKYDSEKKVYLRSVNDKAHIDYGTKEQFYTKNIITYQVSNHTLTGDVKGRQDIDNLGTGTGYYISEGYAVPIKWEKKYKASQTVYTYMDGTEINVNDGNTWIHIQPSFRKFTINGQKES